MKFSISLAGALALAVIPLCALAQDTTGAGAPSAEASPGVGVPMAMPSVPSMPSTPSMPSMPAMPSAPSMPSMPSLPSVPSMPGAAQSPPR